MTSMDRSSSQKINKATVVLNDTINQLDLINIYRAFHPKPAEYTFFSSVHGTVSRTDHMLGHKTSISKFKRIGIIPSIFSKHDSMKLEINYRKNGKSTNMWKLNNMLLKNQLVNEEIKEEIRKYFKTTENKNTTLQYLQDSSKQF